MKFQKKHKPVSKKIWKFLRFIPPFLRKEIIRSQFEISYDLPADYVFKQAETEDEIEQALNIVYESYSLLGYIDQRPEKVHFNMFICMPTTTILIIKHKEEVIGTMSIVPDSAFGLPSESTWDLSKIKAKTKNLAEISSLSIKKSHKSSKGHLLLTLCKLMYEYSTEILELDGIVIAATQEVEPFYTDLLLFQKVVSDTGQEHDLVKGNKSTCCFLDLTTGPKRYFKAYSKRNINQNLSHFFNNFKSPNITLPKKQLSMQALHIKKNVSMIKILEKYPNLKEMFSAKDKLTLSSLDPLSQIEKAINLDSSFSSRVYPRISIRNLEAFIYHPSSMRMFKAQIVDVSNHGFGVKIFQSFAPVDLKDNFILLFQVNEEALSVHAKLQWSKDEISGYLVQEKSQSDWEKFTSVVFSEINLPLDHKRIINKKSA